MEDEDLLQRDDVGDLDLDIEEVIRRQMQALEQVTVRFDKFD